MDINVGMHAELCGLFRLVASDAKTGEVTKDTGWFDNLITDAGLETKGTSGPVSVFHVGTGTTTPAFTDTELDSFLAASSTGGGNASGDAQLDTLPWYGWARMRRRFEVGEATGNLTEVGATNTTSPTGPLFSRALILDENGNPTTLTVESDQILDVWYEARMMIPDEDIVSNIEIDGVMTEVRSRPIAVTASTNTYGTSHQWGGHSFFGRGAGVVGGTSGGIGVRNDDFFDITSWLGVSSIWQRPNSVSGDTYVEDSLERTFSAYWGLDRGNASGGVRRVVIRTGVGSWQIRFDPVIDKNNTKEMNMEFKVTWGRYEP